MDPLVRDATAADAEEIARLHLANFDRNELSSILGPRFVRAFYEQAIEDADTRVRVIERDGIIVGLSMIFFRYGAFESRFRRRARAAFIRFALTSNPLATMRVLRAALSRGKLPHDDAYLGSLVLDSSVRKDLRVVNAFYRLIRENAALLRERSPSGFWASCRVSNAASERALRMLGMHPVRDVAGYPEAVRIFASGTID